MGRWAKIATACLAVLSGLPVGLGMRIERIEPGDVAGEPRSKNASMGELDCARVKKARDETAELFRRPLTRQEYEKRNFMWLRCRTERSHVFDLGGMWFDAGCKHLRKVLEEDGGMKMAFWEVTYVHKREGWGDAVLHYHPQFGLSLPHALFRIRNVAHEAATRYRRTFYMVDCPISRRDPAYVTERASFQTKWPPEISDPDNTIAVYNAPAGPFSGFGWDEWEADTKGKKKGKGKGGRG